MTDDEASDHYKCCDIDDVSFAEKISKRSSDEVRERGS
jgi:hypothetical protein